MIHTHIHPDLDAACSVWAARVFLEREDEISFVKASWAGPVPDGDLALDLDVGIKHGSGTESCFAELINRHAFPDEQAALADLVALVEGVDSGRDFGGPSSLNSVWYALVRELGPNAALESFGVILTGMMKGLMERHNLANNFPKADVYNYDNGSVAVIDSPERGDMGKLFDSGMSAVVYIDGPNLGVSRRKGVEADIGGAPVLALIGEESGWFFHPSGFLAARGTLKSPVETPSSVDPRELADAVASSLGLVD